MSYATSLAKLDPASGLFGAAIPGIIYAMLGSCKTLNVGPEAALSLIVGQAVTAVVHSMEGLTHEQEMAVSLAVGTIITFQVCEFSSSINVVLTSRFSCVGWRDILCSWNRQTWYELLSLVQLQVDLCYFLKYIGFIDVVLSRALLRGFVTAVVSSLPSS